MGRGGEEKRSGIETMKSPGTPSRGGCFSWLMGRKKCINDQPKELFKRSASSKEIISKHMLVTVVSGVGKKGDKNSSNANEANSKWHQGSDTLIEDWSSSPEESYASPARSSSSRVSDQEGYGQDSPSQIEAMSSKMPSSLSTFQTSRSRSSISAVSPDSPAHVRPVAGRSHSMTRALAHHRSSNGEDVGSEVRFGLEDGTKIRFPGQDITPKEQKKPRSRKLAYTELDVENLFDSSSDLTEMELPGSNAIYPKKVVKRVGPAKEAKKAWGNANKQDWLSGMR